MIKNSEETKQADLIMEYFKKNPKREIKHPEIVDWVFAEYKKRTGMVFRDPDRAIRKLSQRLKSNSRVLIPAGTHGGMMEFILQFALVKEKEDGSKIIGFKDSTEIGGEFDPSESFNIRISTDKNGESMPLTVTFDNPNRKSEKKMYLDEKKIEELKQFYISLHKEKV